MVSSQRTLGRECPMYSGKLGATAFGHSVATAPYRKSRSPNSRGLRRSCSFEGSNDYWLLCTSNILPMHFRSFIRAILSTGSERRSSFPTAMSPNGRPRVAMSPISGRPKSGRKWAMNIGPSLLRASERIKCACNRAGAIALVLLGRGFLIMALRSSLENPSIRPGSDLRINLSSAGGVIDFHLFPGS